MRSRAPPSETEKQGSCLFTDPAIPPSHSCPYIARIWDRASVCRAAFSKKPGEIKTRTKSSAHSKKKKELFPCSLNSAKDFVQNISHLILIHLNLEHNTATFMAPKEYPSNLQAAQNKAVGLTIGRREGTSMYILLPAFYIARNKGKK